MAITRRGNDAAIKSLRVPESYQYTVGSMRYLRCRPPTRPLFEIVSAGSSPKFSLGSLNSARRSKRLTERYD